MSTKKNLMDKWIGWVTDSEGYLIRFYGPGAQYNVQRKVLAVFNSSQTSVESSCTSQVGYALRPELGKFRGRSVNDKMFKRLPSEDIRVLEAVLNLQE
jgi:hypothetical protein